MLPGVEITCTPWVRERATFPEHCFYHNPATITFLPRVNRFFVLSNLRFLHCRSLFIFPVTRTKKEKLERNPSQLIFMSSRSRNHDLKRKSHPHSNCSLKKRRRRSKKLRKSKGSSSTNEIIIQKLFRVTQEYHRNCLRKLFLKCYEPSVINGTLEINKQWTRT